MLTREKKNPLENKYSRIYFPIRGKTTQRARKPALFQGSPGPADVPRAAEKSVCGKGQCLHYTPRLLPPRHVHLPGRQKGDGSGAQGSKVALENWICLQQHINASEYLHSVGNSDPISSCSIRTSADGFCGSKAGAILSASAFITAVLYRFTTCTVFTLLLLINAWKTRICPTLVTIKSCFAQQSIAFHIPLF